MAKRHQNSVKLANPLSLIALITLVLSVCAAQLEPLRKGSNANSYGRQQIGPVGLGGGAGEDVVNFTEDTTKLIYNPNVGLVSNNGATGSSRTNPNGFPIPIMETRYYWRNLEGTRDVYTFGAVQADAVTARADLQTLNVRLPYLGNVGDCGATYSDPTWMTDGDLSGWTATHDECGSPAYNYMNFEDPDVVTEFTELITAAEAAMSSYPAWRHGFLETGYGSYGENNYSGTICASSVNSPDACSGGSEIAQYTIAEIDGWYDAYIGVSTSIRKMNMVDNEDLFDYIYDTYSSTQAGGTRGDCWGWQEAATANCPTTGPWMCGIYPRTFGVTTGSGQTASHADVDEGGMVFLESCGSVSTWESSYDYTSSFAWALTNGASALNVKGFYNGGAGIDGVMTTTLRTLGYRYFLDEVRNADAVTAGNNLSIEIDVTNRGVAPDYDGMVWLVKLVEQGGGGDVYQYTTAETLKIAAGASITETLSVPIPAWLDAADYDIYVGAGFDDNPGAYDFPELEFAVTATPADRWYQAGVVAVTNAAPDANPALDYAADFDNAGGDSLQLNDNASISIPSTDFSLALRVKADTLNGYVIAAKGDVGATGQEWSIYTAGTASQQFTFRVSTGSNRTITATTFGIPSTGTWYCLYADFDATNTILRISVNDGALDSLDTTGTITDKANNLIIGGDTTGRNWDGQIDDFYFWKGRRLSDTEQSEVCSTGGDIVQVHEMNYETRRGLTVALEMEENGASYVDDFQHWAYTENGTVTRVSE